MASPGKSSPASPPRRSDRSRNSSRRPSVAAKSAPGALHVSGASLTNKTQLCWSALSPRARFPLTTAVDPRGTLPLATSPTTLMGTAPPARTVPLRLRSSARALRSPGEMVWDRRICPSTLVPSWVSSVGWSRTIAPIMTAPSITTATSTGIATETNAPRCTHHARAITPRASSTPASSHHGDGRSHVPSAQASQPAPAGRSRRMSRRVVTELPARETPPELPALSPTQRADRQRSERVHGCPSRQ